MGAKEELMNRVAELEDVDFFTKQEAAEFAKLVSMTDKAYDEYLELWRDLRRLLKTELVETVKAQASRARAKLTGNPAGSLRPSSSPGAASRPSTIPAYIGSGRFGRRSEGRRSRATRARPSDGGPASEIGG